MPLEFENSGFLWLGLLVPAAVLALRYTLTDSSRGQRILSLLVRVVILLLLVLALAGALWTSKSRSIALWVLGDLSDSVPESALVQITNLYQRLHAEKPADGKLALALFAAESDWIDVPGESKSALESPIRLSADNSKTETNIELALQQAAQTLPHDAFKRVLLLTDGNQTQGDALAAAKRIRRQDVQIFTQAYEAEERDEVLLEDLLVPIEVQKGQSFAVEAIAHATKTSEAAFTLYRDGFKVGERQMTLQPGANSIAFTETQAKEGLTRYELRVAASDGDFYADNNVASGIVSVSGEPRVLLLERNERDARYLARALEAESIRVEIREGRSMPGRLDELAQYDAVLFSDVPATELSVTQMRLLRSYVEDLGGGFVMIGGEESFGLGGYYRTAIEDVLPLRMRSEKKKDTPSLAMMLIVDKSGSMSGEKIELAKEASIAAVELLNERDYVGVIAFDHDPYNVVDLQVAGKMGIVQTISQIQAGGGTSIYPALAMAQESLFGIAATFKHVILLTDGHSQPGDFAGIIDQLAGDTVTVSTVGVGNGADGALLQDIARWGKGRYYFTADAYDIPQIFTKETMSASRSSLVEEPFLPQIFKDHQVIRSIDWEQAPFLFGYVVTSPKATAEVSLITERGDPLLAVWQVGLGRCAAFTSDAKSRWAADWISWPQFGQFWAQLIRSVLRSSLNQGTETTIEFRGNAGSLALDCVNDVGQFLNSLKTDVQLIHPDLKVEKTSVRQIGPGRYAGNFALNQTGSYLFQIRQTIPHPDGELEVFADFTRGLTISYKPEYRRLGSDTNFLSEIARVTGGQYNPETEDLFAIDKDESVPVRHALWPSLLIAALLLFILDVALRRLDLAGRGWFREKAQRYG